MAASELTIAGPELAELLQTSREPFLLVLEQRKLSGQYLAQSGFIVDELSGFCRDEGEALPWELRRRYLVRRAALRSEHPYSASYLEGDGRELGYFLHWYQRQVARADVAVGDLSAEQERAYWSTQPGALPFRRRTLTGHLPCLLSFLSRRREEERDGEGDLVSLLDDYFEEQRLRQRGQGWGLVLTHRAEIVTSRHLEWLERQGRLAAGTAAAGVGEATSQQVVTREEAGADGRAAADALVSHCAARVERWLPDGLHRPLLDYVEHLVHDRGQVKGSIKGRLRTNRALCRLLAGHGEDSFARLGVAQLDEVVSSLLTAPVDDLLRRRQQVQRRHSDLRGFLRFLHRQGVVGRDLSVALISPPCYRAARPATVVTGEQVQAALESLDRDSAKGRRSYAILLLCTTYGLRPVDVAGLRLDALHWREERLALVQSKTGRPLTLPLLPVVAEGLAAYLQQDRPLGRGHREVFLGLRRPHRPLCPRMISDLVREALADAGLPLSGARQLRATVATHLLRQGEAFGTIQDVLGHRSPETTQRYATTDLELLRQVLDESER